MDRIRFKTFASIDCSTPENVPLCAKYRKSIAYSITKDRMPITLTRIIDQLYRDKLIIAEKYGEGSADELKSIIGSLSKLKSDIQTNKPLTPLNDATKCSEIWNRLLNAEKEKLNGKDPVWFACTFLFCDCYFYRRLIEVFEISKTLSSFDPYDKQKYDAFMNSLESITSLSKYSNAVFNEISDKSINDLREALLLMLQISTWGNQCDLALNSEESGSKLEEAVKQVMEKQQYILANDSEKVWDLLQKNKETACREQHEVVIDMILDNAAYELISDLCLADFLCSSGLAHVIKFHVKDMPWFISDANKKDIFWTMQALEQSSCKDTVTMVSRWKNHFSAGKWEIIDDETFWTLPAPYSEMEKEDPELYKKLAHSSLIITKGDLNYRKLLGDINWANTTEFSVALQNFFPAPILALRTIKVEVVVGVDPTRFPEYEAKNPDWMVNGDYAVIQCHYQG